MKKLVIFTNCLLLAVLVISSPSFAQPTSATFSFKMTEEGGFNGILTFNRRPRTQCNIVLLARTHVGNRVIGPITSVFKTRTTKRRIRFNAVGLPQVKRRINGIIPILHLMAAVTCGDSSFDSNVFARRIRCGGDAREVIGNFRKRRAGIKRWLRYFAHQIR